MGFLGAYNISDETILTTKDNNIVDKKSLEEKPYKIPKLIHFVWAGGKKLMDGDKEISNVTQWCKSNSTCEIILWVDSRTFSGSLEDMQCSYSALFENNGIRVIVDKCKNNLIVILKELRLS